MGGAERVDAVEAKNIGLISEIVKENNLMNRAIEIANKIKIHSPSALAKTKKAIWDSTETGLTQALHNAWDLITEQQTHEDFKEGTNSFIEKRSPNWAPYKNNE